MKVTPVASTVASTVALQTDDTDRRAARLWARREVALHPAVVAGLDLDAGIEADALTRWPDALRRKDLRAAAASVPDAALARFACTGTPDDIAAQAAGLAAPAASRTEFGTPRGRS